MRGNRHTTASVGKQPCSVFQSWSGGDHGGGMGGGVESNNALPPPLQRHKSRASAPQPPSRQRPERLEVVGQKHGKTKHKNLIFLLIQSARPIRRAACWESAFPVMIKAEDKILISACQHDVAPQINALHHRVRLL